MLFIPHGYQEAHLVKHYKPQICTYDMKRVDLDVNLIKTLHIGLPHATFHAYIHDVSFKCSNFFQLLKHFKPLKMRLSCLSQDVRGYRLLILI